MTTNLATTFTYRRLVGGVMVSERTYSLLTDVLPVLTLEQYKALTKAEVEARAAALEASIPVCAGYERINEPWQEVADPDPIYDWVDVGQGWCEQEAIPEVSYYLNIEVNNPLKENMSSGVSVSGGSLISGSSIQVSANEPYNHYLIIKAAKDSNLIISFNAPKLRFNMGKEIFSIVNSSAPLQVKVTAGKLRTEMPESFYPDFSVVFTNA